MSGTVFPPPAPIFKVYRCKGNMSKCRNTKIYFDYRTRTAFANPKQQFRYWFYVISFSLSHKHGVLSCLLARDFLRAS